MPGSLYGNMVVFAVCVCVWLVFFFVGGVCCGFCFVVLCFGLVFLFFFSFFCSFVV